MSGGCEGLKVRGVLLGDSVIVVDPDAARALYGCGFYGQPVGIEKPRGPDFEAPLRLSPIEAVYLAERGVLEIVDSSGEPVGGDAVKGLLAASDRFEKLYRVYRVLRDQGLVVRSGLKFGADFTVYRRGPGLEHAPFIVHVYREDDSLDPVELVRAGRLAHTVKKRFVFASVGKSEVSFLMLKWFKP